MVAAQQAPAAAVPEDEQYAKLLVKKVDGKNVKKHLDALQAIANASGGTRAAGTKGYDLSAAYVAARLQAAGYRVTLDPINFVESWVENSPPTLVQGNTTYVPNQDFFTFQPSPAGDVTAQVQAVDLTLPPTPTPTSTNGCEMSDFTGFVPGRIALIQRGFCPFATKVRNAGFAGASGLIIFNEGQPGRTDAFPLDIGEWRAGIPMAAAERDKIRLYLNFDMVSSPNYAYKVYDGDDSDATGAPAGPPGSAQIENQLTSFFDSRGLGHVGTDFDGRSDYGPFIAAGIPAGGIFTGAEGIKTPQEAALFGGTAGVAYDVCYHQACDTLSNVNATALDVNSDAIADSTARYAFNLSAIPN